MLQTHRRRAGDNAAQASAARVQKPGRASDRKARTPFGAPRRQDLATAHRLHARAKTMRARTPNLRWLISAFHLVPRIGALPAKPALREERFCVVRHAADTAAGSRSRGALPKSLTLERVTSVLSMRLHRASIAPRNASGHFHRVPRAMAIHAPRSARLWITAGPTATMPARPVAHVVASRRNRPFIHWPLPCIPHRIHRRGPPASSLLSASSLPSNSLPGYAR